MSDTKWREVLVLTARLGLWFVAAFVAENAPIITGEFERNCLHSPLPERAFERHQMGDYSGSMHGPYKDILWVVFPRRFFVIDGDYAGRKVWHEQKIDAFLEGLAQLGMLPMEVTESFIRVYGYKSAAT